MHAVISLFAKVMLKWKRSNFFTHSVEGRHYKTVKNFDPFPYHTRAWQTPSRTDHRHRAMTCCAMYGVVTGGSRISEWGGTGRAPKARVSRRRRREYQGAAGAEGVGVWGGGIPLLIFRGIPLLIFRPGMLHFEANFRQLTRPVAISLKPAKSCDIVASQPVKSLECHRQTKDRKAEVDLSCCRLKISLTTNHNISDD